MRKEEIEKRLEEIFGKGSKQEIEKATTNEKIIERIVELSERGAAGRVGEDEAGRKEKADGGQKTQRLLEEKQDISCPILRRG